MGNNKVIKVKLDLQNIRQSAGIPTNMVFKGLEGSLEEVINTNTLLLHFEAPDGVDIEAKRSNTCYIPQLGIASKDELQKALMSVRLKTGVRKNIQENLKEIKESKRESKSIS